MTPLLLLRIGSPAAVPPPPDPEPTPVADDQPGDLLEALWVRYDPLLAPDFRRSGWLWRGEAPESEAFPYAVVFEAGETEPEITTKAGHTKEVAIQATVFGSRADARRLGDLLERSLFPEVAPALRWANGYEMTRRPGAGNALELDPDRGPNGEDVWARRVNVVFLVGVPY